MTIIAAMLWTLSLATEIWAAIRMCFHPHPEDDPPEAFYMNTHVSSMLAPPGRLESYVNFDHALNSRDISSEVNISTSYLS